MVRSLRGLVAPLFMACVVALSLPVEAQNYLFGTGGQSWGINIPIENGFINVANGEVHLEISLANHAQRGSLSLDEALVYDSRIWQILPAGSSYQFKPTNVPNSMAGWRFVDGSNTGSVQEITQVENMTCYGGNPSGDNPAYYNYYFNWTDPSGALHQFPVLTQQPISSFCAGAPAGQYTLPDVPTASGYAADSSGYSISVANYTNAAVFDTNGTQVYPTIVDRNGNYYSKDANGNLIDTLGRTPVLKSSSGNQTYYDVLTIGGARKRYTVTTETINVHTSFGQSGVNEDSESLTAIYSIGLPDGSSYTFNYDSGTSSGNYGELQSIILPTGGTVSLNYQNYLDSYQNQNRWLSTYSGGKGNYTFMPHVVTQCTGSTKVGCQEQVTVADGNGNNVVYLLTLNNGAWNSQQDFYNGASSHVMSTATSFNFGTACLTYNCTGAQWITASSVTTTLSDTGQMAQTQYVYDYPAIAKPTKVKMWDYYTGSPSASPTKETDYTYGYSVNGAAFVTTAKQFGPTGYPTSPVAQTTYNYDGGTPTPTSGLPNHGTAPGARGNLTSVVAGVGSTVTTSSSFDDAGTKLSDTDANSNQTTYSTMCSDAFVQTVTYPVIVYSNHLRTMTTFDCSSGLTLSSQDMNGVVSGLSATYQYFTSGTNIGRLQSVSYPDGGGASYSYPSVTETDQVAKQIASVSVTSKSFLDSFGRPYQSATVAPEGTLSSETSYDATGKPFCVSTTHLQGTSSATDGSTCAYYDVLDRVIKTTLPDSNFTTESYVGATQTVTNELTRNRKYTYDAFHRLTSVLEPDPSGTLSYETDYAYDPLDHLTQVDQWGGAKGASSPGDRIRKFYYDSLGRMIAENIPENQSPTNLASQTCSGAPTGTKWTMCYLYDGNGNRTQSTDNSGTSLNYVYDGLNRVLSEVLNATGAISHQYRYDGTDGYGHTNPNGYRTYATDTYLNTRYTFNYDSMGRMTQEHVCLPTMTSCDLHTSASVSASYDLAGNRVSMTYPDGRLIGQTFDPANRFNGVQYSKFGSNSVGTPYYAISSFAPPGQPASSSFGNGVAISSTFNSRQSVASMTYSNSSGTLWSKQFTWDKNGANLLLIKDTPTGNGRQFAYDTLNRVTSAQDVQLNLTPSTATLAISGSEQSYTFNPCPPNVTPCPQTIYDGGGDTVYVNGTAAGGFSWGNGSTSSVLASNLASNINGNSSSLVSASVSGSSVTLTSKASGVSTNYGISVTRSWNSSYFSSPSFAVSAPNSMSGGSSGGTVLPGGLNEAYGYDPFGNLTQSGNFGFSQSYNALNQISAGFNYDSTGEILTDVYSHALTYDAQGMLLTTAGTAETYTYDTDGNRVEVKGATTTDFIYFGGVPVAMLSGGNYTDLIYEGGALIAEVGGTQSAVPTYRVSDNLGTLAGGAPSSGSLTGAVNYAPYGQLFTGSTTDPFGFTGLEWDPTTALWHAGFRQLSPQQGRWMTPDPYEGSYNWGDPQSLNRYAYVNGRPTWGTDPSGTIMLGPGAAQAPGFSCGPVCAGVMIGIDVAEGVYDLGKILGWWGKSFHGSLKPRPNGPWSEHMGGITSLGAPVGSLNPLAGIGGLNQALGLPTLADVGCNPICDADKGSGFETSWPTASSGPRRQPFTVCFSRAMSGTSPGNGVTVVTTTATLVGLRYPNPVSKWISIANAYFNFSRIFSSALVCSDHDAAIPDGLQSGWVYQ